MPENFTFKGFGYIILEWRNVLQYVIGAAAGLFMGALVAILKGRFLWGSILRKEASAEQALGIYIRIFLSFLIDFLMLALIYLLRDFLPFSFTTCIIAAALGLVTLTLVFSLRLKKV